MIIIKSLITAFSMYSRIPTPNIEWKEENRRYSLCFFPFVGIVIGALLILWRYVADVMGYGSLLFSAVAVVIPIAITGGIHMDGFCDVCDAISSCTSKQRQLEIMKDAHIGSFAVVYAILYFIMQLALFTELDSVTLHIIALSFILSRSLSGIAASTFPCAKKDSSLNDFISTKHRNTTVVVLVILGLLSIAGMIYFDIVKGIAVALASLLSLVIYYRFTKKRFDGITGDTEGYFLQVCELVMLIVGVISGIYIK